MKISPGQLQRLRNNDAKIRKALDHGKMTTDYLVERALLKSALGFQRKQVRITSIIRYGKLVETQKEELTEEVAPNVTAAQTWLYNRCPDKWKRDPQKGILDDIDEDTSIKIEVTRAGSCDDEDDEEWQSEVNKGVKVRKATEAEKQQAETEKQKKQLQKQQEAKEVEEMQEEAEDLDSWPDDWDEMIEDE
nr:MAG TPA: terminase small subunit [Caudoviricetes sp.]